MIKKFLNTKFLLFLGLGLFLGLIIILRLSQKPQPGPSPTASPTSSPKTTPSPLPAFGDPTFFQEIDEANEDFYPLLKYLPYKTAEFSVKYIDPLELEITLLGPDSEKAKEKALEWLNSIEANLEKHRLNFTAP